MSNKKAESSHATNDKNQQQQQQKKKTHEEEAAKNGLSLWWAHGRLCGSFFIFHFEFDSKWVSGLSACFFFFLSVQSVSSGRDHHRQLMTIKKSIRCPTVEIELDGAHTHTHRIILQICWDAFFEGVNFNSEKSECVWERWCLKCLRLGVREPRRRLRLKLKLK